MSKINFGVATNDGEILKDGSNRITVTNDADVASTTLFTNLGLDVNSDGGFAWPVSSIARVIPLKTY